MKSVLLQWLQCPACEHSLSLRVAEQVGEEVVAGDLSCAGCQGTYPIVNSVPRFVSQDGYAAAFGFEWNVHRTTQVDSVNGRTDSEDRLRMSLAMPLESLRGKLVLDVGCGTGRFAEVVLKYGGTVIGVDLSRAVDAAFANMGRHPRMHVVQADAFKLPLRPEAFDLIYSLGVLHHTPDCRSAFAHLPKHLKPGGQVVVNVYARANKIYIASTNAWRRLTTRMPRRLLYAFAHLAVPLYYLYRIPGLYHLGMGVLPINMHPNWRWRVLDTFDCYSPTYQSYHTYPEVFRWFEEAGLEHIQVGEPAVTVRGARPVAQPVESVLHAA